MVKIEKIVYNIEYLRLCCGYLIVVNMLSVSVFVSVSLLCNKFGILYIELIYLIW